MISMKSKAEKTRLETEAALETYGEKLADSRLSFYQSPPIGQEISLEEFERAALARLHVLKGIDDALTRGTKPQELEKLVQKLLEQHLLRVDPVTRRPDPETSTGRLDTVSHFVLRIAYCRTEELRRWFLSQECILFKHRFKSLSPSEQRSFLVQHDLPYQPLTPVEFDKVKVQLEAVQRGQFGSQESLATTFYRVPFESVCDLVRTRKVFLQGGFAFVPQEHLASLVVGIFRAKLSKALAVTARQWSASIAPTELDRLTPIVEALSTRHLGTTDYAKDRGQMGSVGLADLDSLSQSSFPLCMRHLFHKVKDDHHLKHFGRMQLGLFLKGIGLELEDALRFWKTEFTKKIPAEKFDKEYAYNIKHNYGKEGKRTDYTPYSCMKIIMSTPGAGDHHGCPFKHLNDDNLLANLRSLRLSQPVINEVMQKKKNQHFQLACSATFEGVHGCACEEGLNHPNQYFEESRKLRNKESPDDKGEN